MSADIVVLRQIRDEGGSRHLNPSLSAEGDMDLEGQDLGDGVERVYGEGIREYEWIWTIRAEAVPSLLRAMGRDGNVLAGLAELFSGDLAIDLKSFLDGHEIEYEVWSRLGD